MKLRAIQLGLPGLVSVVAAFACGGNPEVGSKNDLGDGGTSSSDGGTSNNNTGGSVHIPDGGEDSGGTNGSGGTNNNGTCGGETCGLGQRCETDKDGDQSCVDNECDDLDCDDTEECQPAPGGGDYCADNSCDADVDCPIHRFCDGEICVDDTCTAGEAKCDGDTVVLCSSNGGVEEEAPYTCGSAGEYESVCDDSTPGLAGCTCEDDWDCPNFTTCEVGSCVGTGKEPTCTLPPAAFEDLLPKLEFHWGGESSTSEEAVGKAFPWSSQAVNTPLVINLDDDNGDGKINELDFPEIVFMTFHGRHGYNYDADPDEDSNDSGGEPGDNGVIRAVHGGGPHKGEDYFALCADQHWLEGEPVITDCDPDDDDGSAANPVDQTSRAAALGRAGGSLAAGDLDNDGVPEIVVPIEGGGLQILNNKGEIITTTELDIWPSGNSAWKYPAPAIANLDFDDLAEIVVGNRVVKLKIENNAIAIDKVFTGDQTAGTQAHWNWNTNLDPDAWERDDDHHGPMVCLADLTPDLGLEIVAGTAVYRLPTDPSSNQLELVWDGKTENAEIENEHREGLCAVADVLGETGGDASLDNPLDGKPEVIVVAQGNLLIFDGETGVLRRYDDLNGTPDSATQNGLGDRGGGAPNIDDFDGDGFPEIATALEKFYTVIDLQPTSTACPAWPDAMGKSDAPPSDPDNPARTPGDACGADDDCADGAVCNTRIGECVCLHNGWKRTTEDDSSRTSSSSVFDFNGDGAAEVVYNDECYSRIYEGKNGGVYQQLPSLSRTINENPVVADVDNDGNAEIIFVNNNETRQCSEDPLDNPDPEGDDIDRESLPNGIDVYGDPSDQWVAARRIWNQHSYHVTNVTEGGSIPKHEPESWKPLNGRLYNTYRSQPRNYNVAPDLALTAIQISSPDAACGSLSDTIQIVVEVRNLGDLRVGPGVVLTYEGTWGNDTEALSDGNDPITFTLDKSLEPGASTLVTVEYEVGGNDDQEGLPDSVRVVIDGDERERECVEDNNDIDGPVEAGAEVADLRLEIDSAEGCAEPEVELTVYNDGSAPAEDVLVHLYAGDPSQGGTKIGEVTIDGPIEAGESETVTVELDAIALDITLWGIADPMNSIIECNDANNVTEGPDLDCDSGVK
jgi:hypothetical protein